MVTLLNADRGKTLNFFRNVANADRCRKCWRILERLSGSRGAVKLATQKWEANSKKGAVKRERSMREARGAGKIPFPNLESSYRAVIGVSFLSDQYT